MQGLPNRAVKISTNVRATVLAPFPRISSFCECDLLDDHEHICCPKDSQETVIISLHDFCTFLFPSPSDIIMSLMSLDLFSDHFGFFATITLYTVFYKHIKIPSNFQPIEC